MKFTLNNLKRKSFFWLDKLQISKKERIGISLLLALLMVIITLNQVIEQKFNYSQEEYEAVVAEFKRRSALLEEEKREQQKKYNPPETVEKPAELVTKRDVEVKTAETAPAANSSTTNAYPVKEQSSAPALVNINTATLAELQTLKGIGAAYARRIIEYRETNGGFSSIDELIKVKGIGKKRLENIRPFIKL